MPRLNIEDQFWKEISGLVAKMGDEDKAIGQVIRFWSVAQEKYKQGRVVTKDEFIRKGFSEHLIGSEFVVECEGGFRAVGDNKHFAWLLKRVLAGSKGGKSKSKKKTKNLKQNSDPPKINDLAPKQTEANDNKGEQTESSPSFSPSTSNQNTSYFVNDGTARKPLELIDELKGKVTDQDVLHVLGFISPQLQRKWIKAYQSPGSLENVLSEAIGYYTTEAGTSDVTQVGEWGKKLGGWIRRQPYFKKRFEQISGESSASENDQVSEIMKGLKSD